MLGELRRLCVKVVQCVVQKRPRFISDGTGVASQAADAAASPPLLRLNQDPVLPSVILPLVVDVSVLVNKLVIVEPVLAAATADPNLLLLR